jgi:hypothetical protein
MNQKFLLFFIFILLNISIIHRNQQTNAIS